MADTDTVALRYVKRSNGLRNAAGHLVESFAVANVMTTDLTAGVLERGGEREGSDGHLRRGAGRGLGAGGERVHGERDARGRDGRTIAGTGTVSVSGATATVTLAGAVANGETVTVGYTRPAANPLRDAAGNEVESFAGQAVTNATPEQEGIWSATLDVSSVGGIFLGCTALVAQCSDPERLTGDSFTHERELSDRSHLPELDLVSSTWTLHFRLNEAIPQDLTLYVDDRPISFAAATLSKTTL